MARPVFGWPASVAARRDSIVEMVVRFVSPGPTIM